MNNQTAHPLSVLGIDELEERTYEALLDRREATLTELSKSLKLPTEKVLQALGALESMGLITHSLEQPRQYIPISPNIALEALITERQEDLHRARAEVVQLQKRVRVDQQDTQQQIVELITSPEAERRAFEQMQRTARHEILFLVRPPVRISSLNAQEVDPFYEEAQARGVHYRRITDGEFLNSSAAVKSVRKILQSARDTDEVRVTPDLPFKMVLADRHSALIPLSVDQSDGPVLLLRSSALLDALYTLFEILWERAAPISIRNSGALQKHEPASQMCEEIEPLVQLLATGLNDKMIAHELGISRSTLDRRIAGLRKHLNARTRFQAGWMAATNLRGG